MGKIPTVRLVFDRKHNATDYRSAMRSGGNLGLVQLEINANGERKYMSTSVKLYAGQWNTKMNMVVDHPMQMQYNEMLSEMVSKATSIISQMMKGDAAFSVAEFMLRMTNSVSDSSGRTMKEAMEDMYVRMRDEKRSESTFVQYRALMKHLEKFGLIKHVVDATPVTVKKFGTWMLSREKLEYSTAYNYHSKLKSLLNEEVSRGTIETNPYARVKLKLPENNEIEFLSDDEIDRLLSYQPKTAIEEFVIDEFMFQVYTGLSFVDARKLNLMSDFELVNGKYVARMRRQKTRVEFVLSLSDKALSILKKYGGSLKRSTRQYIMLNLQRIGMKLFGRPLKTHTARKTFAVMALHNGVRIEVVSKMLGHTNITQTQRYAKVLSEDVLHEYERLNDIANGKVEGASRIERSNLG